MSILGVPNYCLTDLIHFALFEMPPIVTDINARLNRFYSVERFPREGYPEAMDRILFIIKLFSWFLAESILAPYYETMGGEKKGGVGRGVVCGGGGGGGGGVSRGYRSIEGQANPYLCI